MQPWRYGSTKSAFVAAWAVAIVGSCSSSCRSRGPHHVHRHPRYRFTRLVPARPGGRAAHAARDPLGARRRAARQRRRRRGRPGARGGRDRAGRRVPRRLRSHLARLWRQGHRARVRAESGAGRAGVVGDHVRRAGGRVRRRLPDRPDRPLPRVHGRHGVLRGGGDRGRPRAQRLGAGDRAFRDGARRRARPAGGDGLPRRVLARLGARQQGGQHRRLVPGLVRGHQRLLSADPRALRAAARRADRLAVAHRAGVRRGAGARDHRGAQPLHQRIAGVGRQPGRPGRRGAHPEALARDRRGGGRGRRPGRGNRRGPPRARLVAQLRGPVRRALSQAHDPLAGDRRRLVVRLQRDRLRAAGDSRELPEAGRSPPSSPRWR